MTFSFWEQQSWFKDIDYTIIGSGITGLNCALELRKRFPEAKILILERGLLPNGASTKNAGFACFGSISEILDDLETHSEEEVLELVQMRVKGLKLLRKNLGDEAIGYQEYGGYELFTIQDNELLERCISNLEKINNILKPIFEEDIFSVTENKSGFQNIQPRLIYSKFEGQLDTGKMMQGLLKKVASAGIQVLNNTKVTGFSEGNSGVEVETESFSFKTGKLLVATNGFARDLGIPDVKPARAQVLITKPIKDLKIRGTFHLDRGYYYFRNLHDRILLGGGRNLNFKAEETTAMGLTDQVQQQLERLLKEVILPGTQVEIDHRWSGIMGVGDQKKPVIKRISQNVICGVRLGGMGIAIGSLVGQELAKISIE